MRPSRWVPARWTRRSGSAAFSVPKRAALVTIISVSPMMALSGVRSSWLILARNCDLCWLAISSWRLFLLDFLRTDRAFWMASTDCAAKVCSRSTAVLGKLAGLLSPHHQRADDPFRAEQRHDQQRAIARAQQNVHQR